MMAIKIKEERLKKNFYVEFFSKKIELTHKRIKFLYNIYDYKT